MRVSDLQPAAYPQSPSVELPNNDAHRLFTNDFNKQSFIENYGDVEIVWNERYKYWEVPAFAESRKNTGSLTTCRETGVSNGFVVYNQRQIIQADWLSLYTINTVRYTK